MKTNTYPGYNGSQPASSSPAIAAYRPESVVVTGVLADYLNDPKSAEEMRQNVRTWFLAGLDGWEGRAGSDLATQSHHFEALDAFLGELVLAACPKA